MGGKRAGKKLARQNNNAKAKSVPGVQAVKRGKHVPVGALDSDSYLDEHVRWTAREIDEVPGEIKKLRWDLKAKEAVELLKFLEEISGKTWRECWNEMSDGHKRNHDHAVSDLPKEAQARLQQLDDGEERVFRFRLTGSCRLWGFRSGNLFRILWYDPNHRVYPVEKRHT